MEWILLLGGIAAVIVLFISNSRMRGEIDRLQTEIKIVARRPGAQPAARPN